ncbi:MAG: hypothetical protein IPM34_08505 [Saprospiraceae bacterium]|nr:hypothetical protein [Saprospiraceae bacterium]
MQLKWFISKDNLLIQVLTFFMLVPGKSQSQEAFSKYLKSQHFSSTDSIYSNFIHDMERMDFRKPLFRQLEFRTETNEFRIDRQEYIFRLSFQNLKDNAYSGKIYATELQLYEQEYVHCKSKMLAEKYDRIVEFYKTMEFLNYYKTSLAQYESFYNTYAMRLHEKTDYIKTLAKIELKITVYQLESSKLEMELQNMARDISPDATPEESKPEIQIAELTHFLESDHTLIFKEAGIADLQQQVEQLKFKQKKSASNQLLDFIQTRFADDPEDPIKEKASVGLGLKIPYVIRNQHLSEDYRFKTQRIRWETEQKRQEWLRELSILKSELLNSCKHYLNFENKLQSLNHKYALKGLLEAQVLDAEDIADLRIEIQMLNIQQLKSKYEILAKYIQYLHLSGHFINNPNLYYLSLPFKNL